LQEESPVVEQEELPAQRQAVADIWDKYLGTDPL
jgi:hypothetical protein